MWGKKKHLKEWRGGLSAIREIEEYIYPSCLSFPGKKRRGRKEERF